ncbi:MAG: nucleotidyltransferase domain-containing protein [Lachnospiraceae bacterium]|nr:nucleotidyltransferase domain-containing protein [Lachnospiraceae bacterium]
MRDIKQEIIKTLTLIEEREHVRILLAVESGSRAWGVESPDSDYDVRFIYVRTMEDYLRLESCRDVIEWQLDEVFDISGWDLRKVLIQVHKGSAGIFEWATSPVIYKMTDMWQEIYEVCKPYFSIKAAWMHYLGLARGTWAKYLQEESVSYKKYIYALRPLLACRSIESGQGIPPVHFEELQRQNLPEELQKAVSDMLAVKKEGTEATRNPHMPMLDAFIEQEIRRFETFAGRMEDDRKKDWGPLNRIFLKVFE